MNNEENKNKRLIDDLKNLPKINAPKNFETELSRKINSSAESKEKSFWAKMFSPNRLAPAAVAIASVIIIFFVVDINSEKLEDPLNIEPRLREDLVVIETLNEIPVQPEQKSVRQKEKSDLVPKKQRLSKEEVNTPIMKRSDNDAVLNDKKIETSGQLIVDELENEANFADSFRSEGKQELGGAVEPEVVNAVTSEISKDKLNFMQRNLSKEDKIQVQQLKMKIQAGKSANKERKSTKQQ